jgi:hypothetical protein
VSGDQQFVVALVALLVNALGLYLNYRKTSETHTLVNGMTKTNTRRSRRSAVLGERTRVAADEKTALGMAPRQLQDKPPTEPPR